jgi:hypothetical protein
LTKSLPSWRDTLPVHPAADLFPLMSESELRELGEDIKKHGLSYPVTLWHDKADDKLCLLDGRNRLDAMEKAGICFYKTGYDLRTPNGKVLSHTLPERPGLYALKTDPYAFVLSANINRRHLTADQKRELIEKLLKAKPEASDRTIAKQTKVDGKTVANVRAKLEGRAEIPHVEKRTDTKGRKQPATKKKKPIHWQKRVHPTVAYEAAARGVTARTVIEEEAREAKMQADWLADHPERTVEDAKIAGTCSDTPEGEAEYIKWMSKRYGERDVLDTPSVAMPADPSPEELAVKRFVFAADSVIETAKDASEFLSKVQLSDESTAKIGDAVDRVIAAWQSIKDRKVIGAKEAAA